MTRAEEIRRARDARLAAGRPGVRFSTGIDLSETEKISGLALTHVQKQRGVSESGRDPKGQRLADIDPKTIKQQQAHPEGYDPKNAGSLHPPGPTGGLAGRSVRSVQPKRIDIPVETETPKIRPPTMTVVGHSTVVRPIERAAADLTPSRAQQIRAAMSDDRRILLDRERSRRQGHDYQDQARTHGL